MITAKLEWPIKCDQIYVNHSCDNMSTTTPGKGYIHTKGVTIGSVAESSLYQRRVKSNENLLNGQLYDNAIPKHNVSALRNGIPLHYQEMHTKENTDYDNVVANKTDDSSEKVSDRSRYNKAPHTIRSLVQVNSDQVIVLKKWSSMSKAEATYSIWGWFLGWKCSEQLCFLLAVVHLTWSINQWHGENV